MMRMLCIAVLISRSLAEFGYEACEVECRDRGKVCQISIITETHFAVFCHKTLFSCNLSSRPRSVCVSPSGSVAGDGTIWPQLEKCHPSTIVNPERVRPTPSRMSPTEPRVPTAHSRQVRIIWMISCTLFIITVWLYLYVRFLSIQRSCEEILKRSTLQSLHTET